MMFKQYLQVTKPGIIFGNLISVIGGFLLASKGSIDYPLFIYTLVGVSLVVASGCVFNNYIDRDIDRKMERTKNRVLVKGLISPAVSLVYATLLEVISWLALTWLFGAGFIGMEIYEFHHLIVNGMGPDRSGFLSAFFALVGTHGLHVTSGLIWMAVLMVQIARRGLTSTNRTRIMCLSLFWHFLDVVWICVFTVVYLMGAM